MNNLLENIEHLSIEAGEAILSVYHSDDFSVEHKADASPLTRADLASHHAIVEGLKRITPDIPVLSEESAKIDFSIRRQWNTYWLVDPLDGTKEFIKRNGEFTVNIALIESGEPILSVVYVPVSNTLYSAEKGVGAFKVEHGIRNRIQVNEKANTIPVIVGSRSHVSEEMQTYLTQLGEHELISMGSSLKLCLVAEGKADLYPRLGPTSEWDIAAAHCVVSCAGGYVVDSEGKNIEYNQKESVLNPYFFVFGDQSHQWPMLFGKKNA